MKMKRKHIFWLTHILLILVISLPTAISQPPLPPPSPSIESSSEGGEDTASVGGSNMEKRLALLEERVEELESDVNRTPYLIFLTSLDIMLILLIIYLYIRIRKQDLEKNINNQRDYT